MKQYIVCFYNKTLIPTFYISFSTKYPLRSPHKHTQKFKRLFQTRVCVLNRLKIVEKLTNLENIEENLLRFLIKKYNMV